MTGDVGMVELDRAGGAGELVLRAARERDRDREREVRETEQEREREDKDNNGGQISNFAQRVNP